MYTTDLNHKVYMFLKHSISFNTEHNKYIFCGKWANEIDKDYFGEKIREIKQLFNGFLKVGKNHEEVLRDLLDLTGNKMHWFSENEIYTVSFIENLKLKNKSINTSPPEQKITHEFFMNYSEEGYEEFAKQFLVLNDDTDYFYKLTRHAKEFNNYSNPIDFEKVQLMYCFDLFKDAVEEIQDYISTWEMNLPTTDLSKIEFEITDQTVNNLKCNTNLQKIELARLFLFLRESKILFFDEISSSRNALLMNQFIENNFNYCDKTGKSFEIKNMNKQFSIVNDQYSQQKQVDYLNHLIQTITDYRNKIKV